MSDHKLDGIRACVFDAYGTLFDVGSAAQRCADALGVEPAGRLATLWRDKQLQYTWLRALQGRHADFWQVTGDALDFALDALKIDVSGLRERLMQLYLTLDCYPEAPAVLRQLRDRGMATAILSNGSPEMLKAAVDHAGITDLFDARAVGRGSRHLQTASQGVPARLRPARGCCRRDPLRVVERLGCLGRLRLWHARGLVQPPRARPANGSPARPTMKSAR